jgi:hypothetical protein
LDALNLVAFGTWFVGSIWHLVTWYLVGYGTWSLFIWYLVAFDTWLHLALGRLALGCLGTQSFLSLNGGWFL